MTQNERYQAYLQSEHWALLRKFKLEVAGNYCRHCKSKNHIHCHHINYRELYDCTIDDLLVLCEWCHDLLHSVARREGLNLIGIYEDRILLILRRSTPYHVPDRLKPKPAPQQAQSKVQVPLSINGVIVLTEPLIRACGKSGVGFSRKALRFLGVERARKGWLKRLIGKPINIVDYNKAMACKKP